MIFNASHERTTEASRTQSKSLSPHANPTGAQGPMLSRAARGSVGETHRKRRSIYLRPKGDAPSSSRVVRGEAHSGELGAESQILSTWLHVRGLVGSQDRLQTAFISKDSLTPCGRPNSACCCATR